VSLIQIENLSKVYNRGDQPVWALRDVSLTVEAGDFVAIMGASGSGKSTFLNMVGCLDVPSAGRYRLAGIDVANRSDDDLARIRNRYIGFVFQSFNLLPRTSALENVEQPMLYAGVKPAERRSRAVTALQRLGLGERMHHLPNQLSGGQQQRVSIARALVNEPQLLLADEPTGALDSQTSHEIMTLFQELNADGMTVVLVTHEADVAEWARRIVRFRDGVIVSDDCKAPLRKGSPA
jgi:putative ABC transport system ATP-binding protein